MDSELRGQIVRTVADLHAEFGRAIVRLRDGTVPAPGELELRADEDRDVFVSSRRKLRTKEVKRFLYIHRDNPSLRRDGAVVFSAWEDGESVLAIGEVADG